VSTVQYTAIVSYKCHQRRILVKQLKITKHEKYTFFTQNSYTEDKSQLTQTGPHDALLHIKSTTILYTELGWTLSMINR